MIQSEIERRLLQAVIKELPGSENEKIFVRPCADLQHGDYQSNAIMVLAKKRHMNPRQLADQVLEGLDLSEICEPVEVSGPGFLNFRLRTEVIENSLSQALGQEHPFINKAKNPTVVVIDFISTNVAKPMQVGHIR